jgi:ribosomal protein S18 acetylase RimI-like enzyme
MSSSLPDGYTLREVAEADAPVVAAVMNAYDAAFATGDVVTERDVRSSWRDLGERGTALLAFDRDGMPAGYVEIFSRGEETALDGYVRPERFGCGVGAAFVSLGERRGAELGSQSVVTGTLGADRRASELFTGRGWKHQRVFLRMAIDLRGDEQHPEPPAGLALRQFRPEDARAFHAAKEEAFADHWNYRVETFEEYRRRAIEADDFDPTLWWVVEDGGEIAAVLRCTPNRFDAGWVNSLGVRPRWRRRGLGELLLRTAFAEFARRGERRVMLGVDAENATGATALYDQVGMRVVFEANVFRKLLA